MPELSDIRASLAAMENTLHSLNNTISHLNRSLDDQLPRINRLEDLVISPNEPHKGLLSRQYVTDQRHATASRLSWLALSSGVTAVGAVLWSKIISLFSHVPPPSHGP